MSDAFSDDASRIESVRGPPSAAAASEQQSHSTTVVRIATSRDPSDRHHIAHVARRRHYDAGPPTAPDAGGGVGAGAPTPACRRAGQPAPLAERARGHAVGDDVSARARATQGSAQVSARLAAPRAAPAPRERAEHHRELMMCGDALAAEPWKTKRIVDGARRGEREGSGIAVVDGAWSPAPGARACANPVSSANPRLARAAASERARHDARAAAADRARWGYSRANAPA